MTPTEQILRWEGLVEYHARQYHLPAPVVLGMVAQESLGNPYAIRVERGFWTRYAAGIRRNVLGNAYAPDDRWLQYPDLAAASYGLMQIMWPVAIERGARLRYPTELCDPELNIDIGCRHLAYLRGRLGVRGTLDQALLRYNGGGDPRYPQRVHGWVERLRDHPRET